ncbi:hypothetical protein GGR56DRAFT_577469 [Xylariaceae sp. FL0804]|nr:hypothetical protein GGR56DRAFT_577469 [Xylariaceae sp. FL0804]
MATAPVPSSHKKMSFAKVAASKPKENIAPASIPRVAVPAMDHSFHSHPAIPAAGNQGAAATAKTRENALTKSSLSSSQDSTATIPPTAGAADGSTLLQAMKNLNMSSTSAMAPSTPSLVVNGSSSSVGGSQNKNDGTSTSDEVSQKADSNSEMGTKAPSLDEKSITSGTTFALDEKESLRPDDSASVKAAEDDESFSIRGSLIANSRMGSEGARVHRLRIGDMPERRIVQLLPEAQDHGVGTPQSGASSQQPPVEKPQALVTANGSSDAFNSIYGQNPDEKLLEAMQSPKDRFFLLQLEQEVINFVQSSKEPYMDLPPNNSFCRMLTHKLADYYHMTHSFEAVQGAVRIYRTPFCRVPPSLASIVESSPNNNANTPPAVILPKKIMRRGEDDGSGQASTSASKATSEVGSDGKEKGPTKEKRTREEREEAYNRARERIFGSSEKPGESTPDTEDVNGMSRASSVSAREKSNLGKRGKTGKQRREDSESFESRSQFRAYYHNPTMEWAPQYMGANMPYNGPVQHPYPYGVPQPISQSYQHAPQAYHTIMPNNGYPQYSTVPGYPPQPQSAQPPYGPSNGSMGGGYGPPTQPSPPQSWQPSFNQEPSPGPYQGRGARSQPQGNGSHMGVPYAYGQLPANANPHDPKSQHPIPGSYNRHAFNPKTQSFVPGSGLNPAQPPLAPYNMQAPHGSPQIGSPHLAYNGYHSPSQAQPYMGGPGYGMSRQGSNSSLSAYHPPPQHMPQHAPAHLSQIPQIPNKPGIPPQGPAAGPGQPYSHLPNYGNPATLPQKPPAGM